MTSSPSIAEQAEDAIKAAISDWIKSGEVGSIPFIVARVVALLAETRGDEGFSSFGANAPSSGTEQESEPAGGLPAQLIADAELLLAWDRFELGDPAPGPLSHREVAARLTLASQRLLALRPENASPPSREPAGDMVECGAKALIKHHADVYGANGAFWFDGEAVAMARACIAAALSPAVEGGE